MNGWMIPVKWPRAPRLRRRRASPLHVRPMVRIPMMPVLILWWFRPQRQAAIQTAVLLRSTQEARSSGCEVSGDVKINEVLVDPDGCRWWL